MNFRKQCVLSNPRLQCLYLAACALLAITLTAKFWYRQERLEYYSVHDYIHVSSWSGFNPGHLDHDRIAATCTDDVRCLSVCGVRSAPGNETCAYASSLASSISTEHVFYLTRMRQYNAQTGDSDEWLTPYESTQNYSFSYSLAVPKREMTTFPESLWTTLEGPPEPLRSQTDGDILTVKVDTEGRVTGTTSAPGVSVNLSLLDLLEMAGLGRDFLDTPQPSAGGAVGRMTGVKLILNVACYDAESHWWHSEAVYRQIKAEWAGIRCEIRVIASSERSGRRDVENRDPAIVEHHYGIHVITRTGGSLSRVNYENIYHALVTAYVLSKIPKLFTLFVLVNFLGHLSKIYKRVIFEPFDIAEQVAGTATRFMANTVSFEELCEVGDDDITKKTMHRRIGEAIKKRTDILDETEVGTFVNFCHKAIVDLNHFGKHDTMYHEMKKISSLKSTWTASSTLMRRKHKKAMDLLEQDLTEVDINSFSVACSSIDKVRILDVMKLFDKDRRTSLMEYFFTPRYIRNLVLRAKSDVLEKPAPDVPGSLSCLPHISASDTPVGFGTTSTWNLDDEERHATVGSKAYAKVLDLEARTEELAAKATSLQAMEKTLQNIFSDDDDDTRVKSGGHSPQTGGGGTQEFVFPEKLERSKTKFVTRKDIERVTQAMALMREEMAQSMEASIRQAVGTARRELLTEIVGNLKAALEEREQLRRERNAAQEEDASLCMAKALSEPTGTSGSHLSSNAAGEPPGPSSLGVNEEPGAELTEQKQGQAPANAADAAHWPRSESKEREVPAAMRIVPLDLGQHASHPAGTGEVAGARRGSGMLRWFRNIGGTSPEEGAQTTSSAEPAAGVTAMRSSSPPPFTGDARNATEASLGQRNWQAGDTPGSAHSSSRGIDTESVFTLSRAAVQNADLEPAGAHAGAPVPRQHQKPPGGALGCAAEPRLGRPFADNYTANYARKVANNRSKPWGSDLGPSVKRVS